MLDTVPLAITDQASTFAGEIQITQKGVYEVVVYAYDPASGNTGVDKTTFVVLD